MVEWVATFSANRHGVVPLAKGDRVDAAGITFFIEFESQSYLLMRYRLKVACSQEIRRAWAGCPASCACLRSFGATRLFDCFIDARRMFAGGVSQDDGQVLQVFDRLRCGAGRSFLRLLPKKSSFPFLNLN
jgi:hypothetical protein